MRKKNSQSPTNLLSERQGKDTQKTNQLKTIFHYLKKHVATNTMISEATGISQKNICRYKRDLEQRGLLAEVRKGYCEITKHLAWYLTTNPDLFPQSSNQLKMF